MEILVFLVVATVLQVCTRLIMMVQRIGLQPVQRLQLLKMWH